MNKKKRVSGQCSAFTVITPAFNVKVCGGNKENLKISSKYFLQRSLDKISRKLFVNSTKMSDIETEKKTTQNSSIFKMSIKKL